MPTGSSDPFALRRAALGVVKIILEKKLPVSLSLAIGAAAKALLTHKPEARRHSRAGKHSPRLHSGSREVCVPGEGRFSYDEVNAVFRAGADDLVDAQKRLVALKAIRKSKNFEPLAVSFKRIRKILEKANLPAADARAFQPGTVREWRAERELIRGGPRAAARKCKQQKRAGKYQEALEVIAGLRKAVDQFFRWRDGDGRSRSGSKESSRVCSRNCFASLQRSRTFQRLVAKSGVKRI